jgi:hypothetical protein
MSYRYEDSDVGYGYDSDDYEYKKEYKRLCKSLRKNDPNVTEVNPWQYPKDYSGELGMALVGNTNVASINLDLYRLCRDGIQSCLLRQIRTLGSLRKVGFAGRLFDSTSTGEDPDSVTMKCFKVVNANPNINELALDIRVPVDAFGWLIRTTLNLHTLDIRLEKYDCSERDVVCTAFGANQSLERLVIQHGSDSNTVESVLLHLKQHKKLRDLELLCGNQGTYALMESLASYIRGTKSLFRLRLKHFDLRTRELRSLGPALLVCTTLEKLAFHWCWFWDVSSELARILQQESWRSSINELCLAGSHDEDRIDPMEPTAECLILRGELARKESGEPIYDVPTIGSSLQHISLSGNLAAGFWFAMKWNSSELPSPSFWSKEAADYEDMFECLPQLVRLQNLKLYGFSQAFDTHLCSYQEAFMQRFLEAFRQNGSVRSLSLYWSATYDEGDPNYEDDIMTDSLLAYVERNAKVPQLLATTKDGNYVLNPSLIPRLFMAAAQAPRTALNNIFGGLLAFGAVNKPDYKRRPCKWQMDIRKYFHKKRRTGE